MVQETKKLHEEVKNRPFFIIGHEEHTKQAQKREK